jgi:hypothetical protein
LAFVRQQVIIDQAADRGAFICQSQSLNIHMGEPTVSKVRRALLRALLTALHRATSRSQF